MRAFSHCRWTVRSDTPRIAAISAKEKPQKNFRSTTSASAGSAAASSSSAALIRTSSFSSASVGDLVAERRDLEVAAALLRLAAARVVDDEAAHDLRGVAHEAAAVGEDRRLAPGDVQVGLVEQGRGPERHPRPLRPAASWPAGAARRRGR